MRTVDTSVVRELLHTSVRVRIPMNIPDYAGILERLLDDLSTIAEQAMKDAYTQGVRDTEEAYTDTLSETKEGRRELEHMLDSMGPEDGETYDSFMHERVNEATDGLDDLFEE